MVGRFEIAFFALTGVVLAVTAEALYATWVTSAARRSPAHDFSSVPRRLLSTTSAKAHC